MKAEYNPALENAKIKQALRMVIEKRVSVFFMFIGEPLCLGDDFLQLVVLSESYSFCSYLYLNVYRHAGNILLELEKNFKVKLL